MRKILLIACAVTLIAVGQASTATAEGGAAAQVDGVAIFGRDANDACLFLEFALSIGGEERSGRVCGEGIGIGLQAAVPHGIPSGIHQTEVHFTDCFVFDGGSKEDNCARSGPFDEFTCVGGDDCFTATGRYVLHTACGGQGFLEGCTTLDGPGQLTITGGTGTFEGATGTLRYELPSTSFFTGIDGTIIVR